MSPEALLYGCGLGCLVVWAGVDVAERRVSNSMLFVPAIFATPFVAWYLAEDPSRFLMHGVQVLSMSVAAVALWLGRVFGGADAKGIMALAWILPSSDYGPPGLFVLLDAVLLAYVASSLWLAVTRKKGTPFFAFLAPSLGALVVSEGFIWLPLTLLVDWLLSGL